MSGKQAAIDKQLIGLLRSIASQLTLHRACVLDEAADRLEQLTAATESVEGSVEIRVAVRLSPTGWYEASTIGGDGDDNRTPMVFLYPEHGDDLFFLITRRRVPSASIHTIPAQVEESTL